MTHPFHPLCGQDFEFVPYRQTWGEDRVHLHDENVQLFSLPAGWTDVAAADPFVVIAAGRCPFTTDGLLALADLADRLRTQRDGTITIKARRPPRLRGLTAPHIGITSAAFIGIFSAAQQGDTGAKKSGGETKQALPSRRAGPATCDRSTARGEPIAVRRRLAYHPEQRAKSTELRSDSDRYLERADAKPGRLHPQST